MINIRNSRALVTGVAQANMGDAIARQLIQQGAEVAILGREKDRTKRSAEEIGKALRSNVVWRALDLASAVLESEDTFRSLVESIRQEIPEIQILVHAAGMARNASFLETDPDTYRQTFAVNVEAPFFLTREIIRTGWMKRGVIVNIGSTVGEPTHGWVGGMVYSMSKAAMLLWSQMLAVQLAPDIRVNTILPGSIDTPMAEFLLGDGGKKDMAGHIPLGRLGTCDEIASVVVELVRNPYISGAEVRLDGARTVCG
jgi:pteridine reductase